MYAVVITCIAVVSIIGNGVTIFIILNKDKKINGFTDKLTANSYAKQELKEAEKTGKEIEKTLEDKDIDQETYSAVVDKFNSSDK